MNAIQENPTFEKLRTGMNERDAAMMRELYAQNAQLTLLDEHERPHRPRVIVGKEAIGEYLDELCRQEVEHHVEQAVVSADGTHAAYREECRNPDGTKVTTTSTVDLRDDKIASQTRVQQGWDGPDPAARSAQAVSAGQAEHVDFDRPDEVRGFGHGRAELVHAGGSVIGRLTLQPGWRWSQDVKPVAGTEWCEAPHFQYQVSGRMHVRMADGTEFESKAGDVTVLPAGHDAWVVGDETAVLVDWQGAAHYGERP
jgi:predicted SnoaL-like aldol condensation-catalyzing enzyme